MKSSIKFLVILALVFTISFTANAQRGERKAPDPEKMAEKQTSKMVEKLALDQTQAAKVQAINLTYAKKMHEAREEHKEARDAMRKIGDAIHSEKSAEMKTILTDAQYKSYEEMEKKRGPHKGGKRGDRENKE